MANAPAARGQHQPGGPLAAAGPLRASGESGHPAHDERRTEPDGPVRPQARALQRHGQPIPGSVETFQKGNTNTLMASPFRFERHGECGMELSEVMPHFGRSLQ